MFHPAARRCPSCKHRYGIFRDRCPDCGHVASWGRRYGRMLFIWLIAAGFAAVGTAVFSLYLMVFAMVVQLPFLLIFTLKKDWVALRYNAVKTLSYVFFTGAILGFAYGSDMLSRSRAEMVIEAVDQYQLQYGTYPQSLEELVPGYLSEIPSPGLLLRDNRFDYKNVNDHATLRMQKALIGISFFSFKHRRWGKFP